MTMEVNGNYNYTRTDYAERLKEKQPLGKSEEEVKKDIANTTIQDEYISSEKSTEKPSVCIGWDKMRMEILKSFLTTQRK